jgi:potassium efflux system protein
MSSVTLSARSACLGFVLLAMASASPAAPDQAEAGGTDGASVEAPESPKAGGLELITRTVNHRRRAAKVATETAALAARIAAAPARLKVLQARRGEPAAKPEPGAFDSMKLDELAGRVQKSQQSLQEARDALQARGRELVSLTAPGPTLSDEIATRKQAIQELRHRPATPPAEEAPATAEARRAYAEARVELLSAEVTRLELQLANQELLVRLATMERDNAVLRVNDLDALNEVLVATLAARRAEEARAGSEEAQITQAQAASLPAALASLATENAELRSELETVTLNTAKVAEQRRVAQRRASGLEADLISARERIETAGNTRAVARALDRRLWSLRTIRHDARQALDRSLEMSRSTDRRIDLGEDRRDLAIVQATADEILQTLPDEERQALGEDRLRAQATELITAKRATIDRLMETYARYSTELTGLDAAERQIIASATTMRKFIRRQLLWAQTLPPLSPADFALTVPLLRELFKPAHWRQVAADIRSAATQRPAPALAGLLLFLVLAASRRPARRALARLSELTARIRTDAFRHTVFALILTIVITAAGPVGLAWIGWLMGTGEEPAPFTSHLSTVLAQLAILLAIFSGNRWLIYYHGLARSHFRWPEPVRVMLRREFPVAMLFVALAMYGGAPGSREAYLALSRPALMLFVVAFAIFFWRVFRRRSAVIQWLQRRHPTGIATRTWALWFPLVMSVPVVILLASAAGYGDAARTAVKLLIDTGWLAVGVIVLRAVMLRWLTVSERQLRYEQAIKHRDEARAEREKKLNDASDDDAGASDSVEVDVPEVDLRELGAQGRAMVQMVMLVGVVLSLWTMWSDLLPALTVLDGVRLPMSRAMVVDGVEQQVAVTLNDALLSLLVLAVTLFASKNLSGILGFTLLRRMAWDAGLQYAIVTLCQYVLVTAGVLYALSTLGVQWSKLQWLVAALGVGLGFGLQEIVANFVSGIILLLERPVRVGDVVTVGDATGRVSRIQIRATTIVDWDRKELVVPNKEFITGRLLNWTLSNNVVRLIIPVGIAYGSDARLARTLLQDAAIENEYVLEEPAPLILFNSFGDNALGLELRVYLSSVEHRLPVQTALHDAIYEKFKDAGIEISFPQRDVHLDTSGPLDIRVHQADDASRGPRRRSRR